MKKASYDKYCYDGEFYGDKFHGNGVYSSLSSNYKHIGEFIQGLPKSTISC